MNKLSKPPIIFKQGINSPEQFGRSSHDCLSIRFPFIVFSQVVFSKVRAISFDTSSHDKGNSSCVAITSLGNLTDALVIAGLFNHRVQSTKPYQFSPAIKSVDINNLAEEINCTFLTHSRDRCQNSNLLREQFLCHLNNQARDICLLLGEKTKRFYLAQQKFLI